MMNDFKEHIVNPDDPLKERIDVFRREYPAHVRRISKCCREIFKNPQNWRSIAFKYKVRTSKLKAISGLSKLNTKNFLTIKRRSGL